MKYVPPLPLVPYYLVWVGNVKALVITKAHIHFSEPKIILLSVTFINNKQFFKCIE